MAANYVLLERIELNDTAASVDFTNIPQSGYTDLKIVVSGRINAAAVDAHMYLTFNNNASNAYSFKFLRGNGAAASSYAETNETSLNLYATVDGNSATSNTFSNAEIYIPNYTSSNYKSLSVDAVQENNATTAYQHFYAGIWNNTAAITSVKLTGSASWLQYSTFSLYGLAAVGTTPVIAPKASGGNITTDGTYWIHTFLTSGTFTPSQGLTCDYLVVAGGGAGGGSTGPGGYGGSGGGGAGGLRSTVGATGGGGSLESAISVASGTSYTIQVGGGGTGAGATRGTSGANSVFSTITATGGGGGGASSAGYANTDGLSGGSGGGGAYKTGGGAAGTGTANQGRNGGAGGDDPGANGAGGGGANVAATSPGTGTSATAGGAGVATSITGSSVTYAGGGGGGSYDNNNFGAGGTGGGGNGGGNPAGTKNNGVAGTANTGGAGGGGSGTAGAGSSSAGGNGGSGIVIIRYAMA